MLFLEAVYFLRHLVFIHAFSFLFSFYFLSLLVDIIFSYMLFLEAV